jgi:hypothetical protein
MQTMTIPKPKKGRKPKPSYEALAAQLRALESGQAVPFAVPDHYKSVDSFRGNLFRCMNYRGLRIRTCVTEKPNELAVYLADKK